MVSRFWSFLISVATITILLPATAGAQFSFRSHLLSDSLLTATSASAGDLDNDGDLDILASGMSPGNVVWFENDGSLGFIQHDLTVETGARMVTIGDVDGDGDDDALAAAYWNASILWWENKGGGVLTEHTLSDSAFGAHTLDLYDFDDDGDRDVLTASWNSGLVIYRNKGGTSYSELERGAVGEGLSSVQGVDMDSDGEPDILTAHYSAGKVVWWEDGLVAHDITTSLNGAHWADAADFDQDGDVDVVCAAFDASSVMLFTNDGEENFTRSGIASLAGAAWLQTCDMDQDGDIDLLVTAEVADVVLWYENDGSANFTSHTVISSFDKAYGGCPVDMDGDGDTDVIAVAMEENSVVLFESDLNEPQVIQLNPSPLSATPGSEIEINAVVRNPEDHSLDVRLFYVSKDSSVADSLILFDDGGHSDGAAGDDIWGNLMTAPDLEQLFILDARVTDLDAGFVNFGLGVGHFTTVGPLEFSSILNVSDPDSTLRPGDSFVIDLELTNHGATGAAREIEVEIILDPDQARFLNGAYSLFRPFNDIEPDSSAWVKRLYPGTLAENFDPSEEFTFELNVYSYNRLCWQAEGRLPVEPSLGVEGGPSLGMGTWSVEPVYPNPFNSSVTVKLNLFEPADLKIRVIDIIGREVAVLSWGRIAAGTRQFSFQPRNLASGTYFLLVKGPLNHQHVQRIVYLK